LDGVVNAENSDPHHGDKENDRSHHPEIQALAAHTSQKRALRAITHDVVDVIERMRYLESQNRVLRAHNLESTRREQRKVDGMATRFSDKLADALEQRKAIAREREEALAECQRRDEELAAARSEMEGVRGELEDRKREVKDLNSFKEKLEKEVDNMQDEERKNLAKMEELSQTTSHLKRSIKDLSEQVSDQKLVVSDKDIEISILEEKLSISNFINDQEKHFFEDQLDKTPKFNDKDHWNDEIGKAIKDIESQYKSDLESQTKQLEEYFHSKISRLSEMNQKTLNKLNDLKNENRKFEDLTSKLNERMKVRKHEYDMMNEKQAEKIRQLEKALQDTNGRANELKSENEIIYNQLKAKKSNLKTIESTSPRMEIDSLKRIIEVPKKILPPPNLIIASPVITEVAGKYLIIENRSDNDIIDLSKWKLLMNENNEHRNLYPFNDGQILRPGELKKIITVDYDERGDSDIVLEGIENFGSETENLLLERNDNAENEMESHISSL